MIFPEEPLSLSGDQGCGFFLGRIGLLLNNGRYEILRKLGRGRYSNTWLVSDSRYVCNLLLSPLSFSTSRQSAKKASLLRCQNTDG